MRKKTANNPYYLWADILRILAIYLVIAVHTSFMSEDLIHTSGSWPYIVSFTLIKTCVPLFVMLSGALLLGKNEAYRIFFRKRIIKVLIPWLLWTFIYMGWNYYAHGIHPASTSEWKYFFELTFFTQLWFLPLIFALYLLTPVLRLLTPVLKKTDKIFIALVWILFVCIAPYFHTGTTFPVSGESGIVPVTIYYTGYFLFGYILTTAKLPKKMARRSMGIILIGVAITFLEIIFSKGSEMVSGQLKFFDYFAPGIAVCSVGIFLFIFSYFKKTKVSPKMQSVITLVSSATLGIYIVHGLIKEILNPYLSVSTSGLTNIPLLGAYILALILFVLSLGFVLLLKKVPILKIIVP